MNKGIIVKNISNLYVVSVNNKKIECTAKGSFRNKAITPLVGDNVIINENNVIEKILERKNSLVRPPLSNIDQVIIVMSFKKPDFSAVLLDKLLVILEHNKIKPIICFTKIDLLENKKEYNKITKYYKSIGYKVLNNNNLFRIKRLFKNKITVLSGQSGAGKSTLLNKLDKNLELKTDEISLALNRGKHTTRHVELYNLFNGLVADTPGFSSIDLNDMKKENIKDYFIEFKKYKCKYDDCSHTNEVECLIKNNDKILNTRYKNYVKFMSEVKNEFRK